MRQEKLPGTEIKRTGGKTNQREEKGAKAAKEKGTHSQNEDTIEPKGKGG